MPGAYIEIQGMDALVRKVGSIEKAQNIVEPVIVRHSERIGKKWHTYPPMLPSQRYRRTGKLGRGRRQLVQRTPLSISAIARNDGVPYNVWVIRTQSQAGIHRGRWNSDERLVESESADVVRDASAAIQAKLDE